MSTLETDNLNFNSSSTISTSLVELMLEPSTSNRRIVAKTESSTYTPGTNTNSLSLDIVNNNNIGDNSALRLYSGTGGTSKIRFHGASDGGGLNYYSSGGLLDSTQGDLNIVCNNGEITIKSSNLFIIGNLTLPAQLPTSLNQDLKVSIIGTPNTTVWRTKDYIQLGKSSDQTGVTTGTLITWDSTIISNNISRNGSNIQLNPNKIYKIMYSLTTFLNSSSITTFDVRNGVNATIPEAIGFAGTAYGNVNFGPQTGNTFIYNTTGKTGNDLLVRILSISSPDPSYTVVAKYSNFLVHEI